MEGTETGRKGAAKRGSFEGAGTGWKGEEVIKERVIGIGHERRGRAAERGPRVGLKVCGWEGT